MHEVVSMNFSSVLSARQLNREKKEGGTKRRERERERGRQTDRPTDPRCDMREKEN